MQRSANKQPHGYVVWILKVSLNNPRDKSNNILVHAIHRSICSRTALLHSVVTLFCDGEEINWPSPRSIQYSWVLEEWGRKQSLTYIVSKRSGSSFRSMWHWKANRPRDVARKSPWRQQFGSASLVYPRELQRRVRKQPDLSPLSKICLQDLMHVWRKYVQYLKNT
jgi:hypothetical protein